MQMDLPANVESALHPLLGELALAGAEAVKVQQSPSFGDFLVFFVAGRHNFAIARDRGQFIVQGPERDVFEPAGLWKAFNGVAELSRPLLLWVRRENVA